MILQGFRKTFAPLLLALLLLVSSCTAAPPSRFEQAQRESTQRGAQPAVVKEATQGAKFNKFFPKSADGFQVVPAQEKKGFAEYKLNKGGKNVAVLSISDTASTPDARTKFASSSQRISGYPVVAQGANGTAALVGNRYQVKVQSRDASFTKSDREAWLAKFNLGGLAALK
jgi:hypothetical protein